jgi:hypothetical protein
MKEQSRLGIRALRRAVQLAAASLAIAGVGAVGGCLTRPLSPLEPFTTSVVVDKLTQSGVDKIDLVLVVDNSASMADKQYILSLAIPDLVGGLVQPKCLDNNTMAPIPTAMQPTSPTQTCPSGSTYEFNPVLDMHIGLLSSSLGSFGADGCPEKPPAACSGATPNSTSNDDHGHLVTRTDPCGTTNVPTYQSLGFLQWDPAQALTPPGIQMASDLQTSVTNIVLGEGQYGCGFEAQDEAWYRFLIDPTPYQSISLVNNQVQVQGTDSALLDQRKAFLRPDSLLAIVVVSDETDTSVKEYSSYPLFAAPELHLPHPSAACNFGSPNPTPKDPCCYSCGQSPPNNCQADPACTSSPSYTAADENTSLRAFGLTSHKARYGIEFFYQPSRYVTALTSATVTDVNGKDVPNPIFSNLNPAVNKGAVRDPGLVFYAAIVGVPWQLIARQNNGVPDLIAGVNSLDPTQTGGFKTAAELALNDGSQGDCTGTPSMPSPGSCSFWDDIAGDPENYVNPKSPFMIESTVPRSGTDPITKAQISPSTTANGSGSSVGGSLLNDHERTIANPPDDIEYACIFDLPTGHTRDCTQPGVSCDCPASSGTPTDNPLCQGTMQVKAKAYPGLKELAIARGMGTQGIAASICPKQLTDPNAADYGYHPAVQAIIDRLKLALHGQCLPRTLTPDASGQVTCLILEASHTAGACNCDPAEARGPILDGSNCPAGFTGTCPDHRPAQVAAEQDPLNKTEMWNCFCEINQLQNPAGTACPPSAQIGMGGVDATVAGMCPLTDCQSDANVAGTTNGWCYVDAQFGLAEKSIVSKCPVTEQHEVRFVGKGQPNSGSTLFITCSGQ